MIGDGVIVKINIIKMKIVSWNINGIRAALKNGFAESLAKLNPDLIGLQEVKIDDGRRAAEAFEFKGYEDYWHSAKKPGYSGTAILTKSKPLQIINGIERAHFDDEGRTITAEYEQFFFINNYFPNAQPELKRIDYKEDYNRELLAYAKQLEKKKPVIICGDLNVATEEIDLARPKENVGNPGFSDQERYWGREYLKAGFVDSFRHLHPTEQKYSWWSYRMGARAKNVGWRIDYILLSPALVSKLKAAEIRNDILGSDHCPVEIEIDL
jgi:exodeoxyribonuclease-3